ncbi:hypothetical protein Tco_1001432 [Tanacetum coccineum]
MQSMEHSHLKSNGNAQLATFEILGQLSEFADSLHLQGRMKVWFVQKRAEEEDFAGFLRDQCAGLRMTNNKNRRLRAELEALGERGLL